MRSPLLATLVSGVVVLAVWLVSTSEQPVFQTIRQAGQVWLEPVTPEPRPTAPALVLARPAAAQTAVPPTLQPPTAQAPTATPTVGPTPATTSVPTVLAETPRVRSYAVPLEGGGEMIVVATDLAAALDNVVAQGGTPALPHLGNVVEEDRVDVMDFVAEDAPSEGEGLARTPLPASIAPAPLPPPPPPVIVPPADLQPAPSPPAPPPQAPRAPAAARPPSPPSPLQSVTKPSARDGKPDKDKHDKPPKAIKGR